MACGRLSSTALQSCRTQSSNREEGAAGILLGLRRGQVGLCLIQLGPLGLLGQLLQPLVLEAGTVMGTASFSLSLLSSLSSWRVSIFVGLVSS